MMTPNEAEQFLQKNRKEHATALEALVPLVRTAALVLKDGNQPSLAKEMERQLYLLDSLDAHLAEVVNSDPGTFIEAMSASLRRRR